MNILTPSIVGEGIFTSAYGGRSQKLSIQKDAQGWSVQPIWNNGIQGYMSSPVIVDGHAYLFLRSNRFACIDLSTGEERWTSGPTGDSYWSLAFQGERILALSDRGVLRLIQASPKAYQLLSERELEASETWAHVAPAGAQLLVRSQHALLALAWR